MGKVMDIVGRIYKPFINFFAILYKTKLQFTLLINFAGIAIAYQLLDKADHSSSLAVIISVLLAVVVAVAFFIASLYVWKKIKDTEKPTKGNDVKNPSKVQSRDKVRYLELQKDKPQGVVFGKNDDKYICKPENMDGHVMVVGGVGTGKSSRIAIPTLRNWGESFFAIDIKGELYKQTEEYCDNIMVFNPLDKNSYGYDPFFCLRESENPAQDARAIAQAIIPLPIDTREPFWIQSAQNIFTSAILHYSLQGMSFLDTIGQIQKTNPKELIKELSKSADRNARYYVNSLADMEEKTLSSVMTELSNSIVHFVTDKHLISALSRENNINPDYLELGNNIYINIPEHLLNQWETLLTLIVNQFLTKFQQRSEGNAEKDSQPRPILFLLDEFPRLGKIDAILNGLATLRSKKIHICLIIQSLAQLDDIYGETKRKIIADTCAFKAILGATDVDSQDYFSRLGGTYEKLVTSHGTSSDAFAIMNKGKSTNTQEMERPLIKPQNFGFLDRIVLYTPFPMPYEEETSNTKQRKLGKLSSSTFKRSFYVPLEERDPIAYQWKTKAKVLEGKFTEKDSEKPESFIDKHVFSIINEMAEDVYDCINTPTPVSQGNSDEILAPFGYVDKLPHYAEKGEKTKGTSTNGFVEYLTEKHVAKPYRILRKWLYIDKRKRYESIYMLDFLFQEDNLRYLQPNVFFRLINETEKIYKKYIKRYKKMDKIFSSKVFSLVLSLNSFEKSEEDFVESFEVDCREHIKELYDIKDKYFVDKSK